MPVQDLPCRCPHRDSCAHAQKGFFKLKSPFLCIAELTLKTVLLRPLVS
jgi:hypothetical protein